MKRFLLLSMLMVASTALPRQALAVDLINEDEVAYDVLIEEADSKRTLSLRPGESVPDICRSCDITVDGIGTISTQHGDTIIIRGRNFQVTS